MTLRTERLLLRRTRLSDAPALFAFLGDPLAMQYTRCFPTLAECRRAIAAHERERRKTGNGPWTIIRKDDGAVIGWGGLYEDPFDPGWGLEIGYWFAPLAWGQGYASELVRASLGCARAQGVDAIGAFARPENVASCRVLEKAGFRHERYVPSLERNLYRWRGA